MLSCSVCLYLALALPIWCGCSADDVGRDQSVVIRLRVGYANGAIFRWNICYHVERCPAHDTKRCHRKQAPDGII
jgi:hypothetical protein